MGRAGMTDRKKVYLHVGSPKSGTTYLQSVLRGNIDRLADAGVLVAGKTHTELVHAGLVLREDPRAEKLLDDDQRKSWDRVVQQVAKWRGHAVIISYELLSAASAEQARRAGVRLVRFLYTDNGGITRGKATHVVGFAHRLTDGIGLTVAMQAMNMLDQLQPVEGLGPVGEIRLVPDPATFTVLPYAAHAAARYVVRAVGADAATVAAVLDRCATAAPA